MNTPKILKPFLKPTSDEGKYPTDVELDDKIMYVSHLLHDLVPMIKHIIFTQIKLFFQYRWKYIVGRIMVFGLIVVPLYFLLTALTPVEIITHKQQPDVIIQYPTDSTMNLRNFLLQIAYCESRYKPEAGRDNSQFWGLYQLGDDARQIGGYGDVPRNVFLSHPEIQDLCMINFLKYEKEIMQEYIDKYDGKIVDGVLLTESGILALSHLGCGYAKNCLDSGKIPDIDENGNHPRNYAKLGGYRLNLDKVRYSIEDAN